MNADWCLLKSGPIWAEHSPCGGDRALGPCSLRARRSLGCSKPLGSAVAAGLPPPRSGRLSISQSDPAGETLAKGGGTLLPALTQAGRSHERQRARRAGLHAFPRQTHTKLLSTNQLERLNKEMKHRADVVGIFSDEASIMRLIGAVLFEQNIEWQTVSR
ncbi:hypothetical protein CDV52_01500 [Haematobacter missouriensis]|uniref:Mutator family transposase n=1 Tax=Haematobacter missouriensis TaxID=366616 RepID=A0A212AWM0_9RHOB|nr:hypothetical protein CDV53_19370 [Haematobacter missouriensis]OWJ85868.1 hypothetical protein CDV52_01500 [Haematobacter missouriensis]